MDDPILMGIAFVIFTMVCSIVWMLSAPKTDQKMFCRDCGKEGMPVLHVKGSGLFHLIVWFISWFAGLLWFIIGIAFTAWRYKTRKLVCEKCGSHEIIPARSARAIAEKKNPPGNERARSPKKSSFCSEMTYPAGDASGAGKGRHMPPFFVAISPPLPRQPAN